MRKAKRVLIALLLGIVTVFGVAGCNKEPAGNKGEESTGTFYTLQEACDNGWLTQADLMSIAYYHNGGRWHNEEIMSEDYVPAPKTPEVLSKKTELKIKNTAAKDYRENYNINDAEADGFRITEYCGTYNGCVAIMMRDDYSGTAGVVWTDTIAGVNIYYNSGRTMQIWSENKGKEDESVGMFYTLPEVYDNGFLDISAIMHISYYLTGSVHEESGNVIDFVPEKTLSKLPKKTEDDIKTAYFKIYPKAFQDGEGNYRYGKEILNVTYFGEYNNYYVVIVDSDLWNYGAAVIDINIGGIVWGMSGAPILVFSYNK